jgi:hypothetical protein
MKQSIGMVIRFAAISLLVTACGHWRSFTSSWRSGLLNEDELQEMDVEIGISESCLPPCWYGLIPYESTTDEVRATLSELEIVEAQSIEYSYSEDGDKVIVQYKSALVDSSLYGGRLEIIDGILNQIEIVVEYELSVQELLDVLGEPDFYEIVPYGGESTDVVVRLLWLDNGLLVSLPEFPPGTRIGPDMLVKRMVYSKPGATVSSYLENKGSPTQFSASYISWNGFGNIILP